MEATFELFTFGGDEEYPGTSSVAVEGAVEVHDLVFESGVRWRILDLGPFGDEIGQSLRFDRRAWRKLNCEGAEFYCPFDDSAVGVPVV